jgi:hypothetical protein
MKINEFIKTKEAENALENDTWLLDNDELKEKYLDEHELEVWNTYAQNLYGYFFHLGKKNNLFYVAGNESIFYTEFDGEDDLEDVYKYLINRMEGFYSLFTILQKIVDNNDDIIEYKKYEDPNSVNEYVFELITQTNKIKILFDDDMIYINDDYDENEIITYFSKDDLEKRLKELIIDYTKNIKLNQFIWTEEAENAKSDCDTYLLDNEELKSKYLDEQELKIWNTCVQNNPDYFFQLYKIDDYFAVAGKEDIFYCEFDGEDNLEDVYGHIIVKLKSFYYFVTLLEKIKENDYIVDYETSTKEHGRGYCFVLTTKKNKIKVIFFDDNDIIFINKNVDKLISNNSREEVEQILIKLIEKYN